MFVKLASAFYLNINYLVKGVTSDSWLVNSWNFKVPQPASFFLFSKLLFNFALI